MRGSLPPQRQRRTTSAAVPATDVGEGANGVLVVVRAVGSGVAQSSAGVDSLAWRLPAVGDDQARTQANRPSIVNDE